MKEKLTYYFHNPNYEFFLASMVLFVIVPPFAILLPIGQLIMDITFGLVVLLGAFFTASNMREFGFSLSLGIVVYLLFLVNYNAMSVGLINVLLNLLFFLFIFWKLMKYVLSTDRVSINSLFACISGYLVLGIVSATLFDVLHCTTENAFNALEGRGFYDLVYFSFCTLTSVGYGDIVPIHPMAKSLTILVSITGQLYLTFLVAIIIGKYLAHEALNNDQNKNES